MILDIAETVLGYFGFDRTVYGNKKITEQENGDWLEELRHEREKDNYSSDSSSSSDDVPSLVMLSPSSAPTIPDLLNKSLLGTCGAVSFSHTP